MTCAKEAVAMVRPAMAGAALFNCCASAPALFTARMLEEEEACASVIKKNESEKKVWACLQF
jgi:hypothetical protein